MLDTAVRAAREGGLLLSKYFEQSVLEREEKDDKSFVTKADTEAERVIVDVLKHEFPAHGFLGEEGADEHSDREYCWVIDPLDATRNFANGIPIFAISIALVKAGEPVAAVVYNPVTKSLYAAEKGKGTTYNGNPARVSTQAAENGVITFGPGQKEKEKLNALLSQAENFFKSKRYLGCTALELGYVARGGTEAYVCIGLKNWDYAAGALLVTEAGGTITGWQRETWSIEQNFFVASNGVAHDAALRLVQSI